MTPLRARVGVRGVGGRHSSDSVPRILAASETLRRLEGGLTPGEEEEERAGREK